MSFVLPIIVDSICARFLPGLFKPNFLAYTKNPDVSFAQVSISALRSGCVSAEQSSRERIAHHPPLRAQI